ncbi:hypothetical protein R3W88_027434 [Solanum pinnatisectum]|uniref:Non-specific lipid-transfer protein n=1 Tax=Solanum pinnatisectum TaxID=50273 RepID=A0AAV9LJI7_9SOLN|nr:hypothetical protein R3W88_027434 [Solanum pinnatisectum]
MVMVAPYASEAFSCGQVQAGVVKCLPYLQNRGPVGHCCDVVKGLMNSAKTTQDRRTACSCLKSAASIIKGIDMSKAAGLPALCGVKSPFKISLSTDCTKYVHFNLLLTN